MSSESDFDMDDSDEEIVKPTKTKGNSSHDKRSGSMLSPPMNKKKKHNASDDDEDDDDYGRDDNDDDVEEEEEEEEGGEVFNSPLRLEEEEVEADAKIKNEEEGISC